MSTPFGLNCVFEYELIICVNCCFRVCVVTDLVLLLLMLRSETSLAALHLNLGANDSLSNLLIA
jgi:hypothetical protein